MLIISKLKLWGVAFFAFMVAVMSARYYKSKLDIQNKEIKAMKTLSKNKSQQLKAIKKHITENQKEIDDALKDDSYIDYFDSKPK